MAVFTYKAIANGAADVSGTISADTPRQARDLLRDRGLVVREIADYRAAPRNTTAAIPRPARRLLPGPLRRIRRGEVTTVIRELSTLLGVGMPLLEALQTLAAQHTDRLHTSILLLRDQISSGSTLADAMREQPRLFDDLAAAITSVGEDSGTLDTSLERLAEFRQRSEQFRNRLATALIYPAIVSAVALCSTLFLMSFVVPKIIRPLLEQGMPLPLPTKIVKFFSDFLMTWWWAILLAGGAIVLLVAAWGRSHSGTLRWHSWLLRLPLIGELTRKQAIVRIAVVMSALLKSGLTFVRAMQIAQQTTGNLVIRDALRRGEVAVIAGGDIGAAIEETKTFGPMVVQVFALGQQSGRLEEMLDRLALTYEQEVNTAAERLTSILEPTIIVILALVVLLIVMATVLPILEAGNAIQ
jgi:type II secretory pathway component PulF